MTAHNSLPPRVALRSERGTAAEFEEARDAITEALAAEGVLPCRSGTSKINTSHSELTRPAWAQLSSAGSTNHSYSLGVQSHKAGVAEGCGEREVGWEEGRPTGGGGGGQAVGEGVRHGGEAVAAGDDLGMGVRWAVPRGVVGRDRGGQGIGKGAVGEGVEQKGDNQGPSSSVGSVGSEEAGEEGCGAGGSGHMPRAVLSCAHQPRAAPVTIAEVRVSEYELIHKAHVHTPAAFCGSSLSMCIRSLWVPDVDSPFHQRPCTAPSGQQRWLGHGRCC